MYFFVNLQISWPVWRKVTLVTFKWFSPVCFLRWVLRVPLSENVFPHGWHSISFLSGLHSILILFLSLWRKWRDWGSIFLRNVKSKKKQSLHYSKSLKVKVSCQIQRVTKCWYALIITIIIIIFITTHYYIKQQFLVLGRGFSQWYDSLYFFLIQSFSPILPWYWRCFRYEISILVVPKTHFILFGSFLWLEIQPHDDKNSILNDVQWLWLFWNPPNIKTHGYYTC